MTRRLIGYFIDLFLVGLTAAISLLVRDNFELSPDRLLALVPYASACVLAAAFLLPLFGTTKSIWRLSTTPDYILAVLASIGTVMAGSVLGFGFNRLDGIARSLPFLHVFFLFNSFVAVRFLARIRHESRSRPAPVQLQSELSPSQRKAIMIVGRGRLLEAYLRAHSESPNAATRIAGILSPANRLAGRTLVGHPVLGTPEEITAVLRKLESHNDPIDRIVIAMPRDGLSETATNAIALVQKESRIEVVHLSVLLGIERESPAQAMPTSRSNSFKNFKTTEPPIDFSIAVVCDQARNRSTYWTLKRILDGVAAATLILVCIPLFAIAATLTFFDVGKPLVFWQNRPGLGGQLMRVYKFRTMSEKYDQEGRRVEEGDRVSQIGEFMRRTRLDELPQLINVLFGTMSIVGPRPLLPTDQAPEHAARLLVRPGLTGWAQVQGGRTITASDKAALDVWYIMNASLPLDIRIAVLTASMLLQGEQENPEATEKAWHDLVAKGVCDRPIHEKAARPRSDPSNDATHRISPAE